MSNIICVDCGHAHRCTPGLTNTINATNYTVTLTDGTVDK
jgi:hypothetical protein